MTQQSVSVILPTFNESGNIVELVQNVLMSIPPDWRYEILVVDDNSPDGTYELVRQTFEGNPKVLSYWVPSLENIMDNASWGVTLFCGSA